MHGKARYHQTKTKNIIPGYLARLKREEQARREAEREAYRNRVPPGYWESLNTQIFAPGQPQENRRLHQLMLQEYGQDQELKTSMDYIIEGPYIAQAYEEARRHRQALVDEMGHRAFGVFDRKVKNTPIVTYSQEPKTWQTGTLKDPVAEYLKDEGTNVRSHHEPADWMIQDMQVRKEEEKPFS